MSYGKHQYGQLSYGDESVIDQEAFEHLKPDLMIQLPLYYRNSFIMKEMQNATSTQLGLFDYIIEDLVRQFYVDTATWGLVIYEKELGIKTNLSQSYEERREIVKARWRGEGTTTKDMIKNTAVSFSGGEVDVIEENRESRFIVKFVGVLGIPRNMQAFLDMLETIKPAHLEYEIKYTYTTWDMISHLTWDQAGSMTWNELRTYEGE